MSGFLGRGFNSPRLHHYLSFKVKSSAAMWTPSEFYVNGGAAEITFSGLVAFRAGWSDALTTQRRNQEAMKGFVGFCVKSDLIVKTRAADLDSIPEGRPTIEPFTRAEMDRISPVRD